MARKLYIHVGPAKTGTSAIQDALRRHDNGVVIYPKVGLWADGSHHNLVFNFYSDFARPEVEREDIAALFARIVAGARGSERDVVISSEVLGGRRKPGLFIRALREQLGPDFDVEILLVVREHLERAASIYNQRVKDAVIGERRGPDEFLVRHVPNILYAPMLRRFRNTGFPVRAVNYHPVADFAGRFLAVLGFAADQIPRATYRNVSLSIKALMATLAANRVAPSLESRRQVFEALRTMPGFYGSSRAIFTSDAVSAVAADLDQERRYLTREFGIELETPQVGAVTSLFQIGSADFDDIAAATKDLGEIGAQLRAEVRSFVAR